MNLEPKLHVFLTCLLGILVSTSFYSQSITITGTVVDENEQALPGASVIIKAENRGTSTDFDGNFSLEVQVGDQVTVSYIGFVDQTFTVGNQDYYSITLETSDGDLEEVVVMGYSSLTRSELTGSAVQVKSDEIGNFPVTSADQILQGKVPGLYLWGTSGTPGSVSNVLIRGRTSVNASNGPLYVVDGIPINAGNLSRSTARSSLSPLTGINPNDIESITVLKDATATAQYGARGSGGVIVITTKKPESGEIRIRVDANYGWQNDAIPGPTVLTAEEREELYFDGLFNTYGASQNFTREGAQTFYENNPRSFGTTYTRWREAGSPVYNWAEEITVKNAPINRFTLSANGGGQKSSFRASASYGQTDGTVIGTSLEQFAANLDVVFKPSDTFQFSTINRFSFSEQDGILESSAYFASPRTIKYFMPPTSAPYNEDGTPNINNLNTNIFNPIYLQQNDIELTQSLNIVSTQRLLWKTPIKNLNFETVISTDYTQVWFRLYGNRVHGGSVARSGFAAISGFNTVNFTIQNIATYNLIQGVHNLKISGIQEYIVNKINTVYSEGENFSADGLFYLNSAGEPSAATGTFSDGHTASYKVLANYTFDNRFVLNANYTREGSSLFPKDSRWGDFYSLGTSWNLDQEDFVRNITFIDILKPYANFGTTGNAGIARNTYQASLSFSSAYNGSAGIAPARFGNSNLQWEVLTTWEAGLRFALLSNGISGDFTYYQNRTGDMLLNVPLSRTTGFSSQNRNVGRMKSQGFELTLSSEIINKSDYGLSISGSVATNNNEIVELAKDGNGDPIEVIGNTRIVEGQPLREFFHRGYAGVDPQTGEAEYWSNEEQTEKTKNYSEATRIPTGKTSDPTINAAFNIRLRFKGFFLNAQATYAGGHLEAEPWTLYTRESTRYATDSFNGINSLLNRWQVPGDITDTPAIRHAFQPWQVTDRFVFDGDFIRLRDATLGYNFSYRLLEETGINAAQIYIRGVNLLTWTKDKGLVYDPEYLNLATPPTKNIVLGIVLDL